MKKLINITDLKDMLKKTGELYGDRPAYKIREGIGQYKIFTHKEVREMIDALGTALIDLGLQGKRIAIIGKNRYEWEIAYLAIACGTGTVVPLDKSLPDNEIISLAERSEAKAIVFEEKYLEIIKKIKNENLSQIKKYICLDFEEDSDDGILSYKKLVEMGKKLLENGNRSYIDTVEFKNIVSSFS